MVAYVSIPKVRAEYIDTFWPKDLDLSVKDRQTRKKDGGLRIDSSGRVYRYLLTKGMPTARKLISIIRVRRSEAKKEKRKEKKKTRRRHDGSSSWTILKVDADRDTHTHTHFPVDPLRGDAETSR